MAFLTDVIIPGKDTYFKRLISDHKFDMPAIKYSWYNNVLKKKELSVFQKSFRLLLQARND
jgi:hypothetical protein